MSLAQMPIGAGAIAQASFGPPRPVRAPTKRTLVVQRDLTTVPEAR